MTVLLTVMVILSCEGDPAGSVPGVLGRAFSRRSAFETAYMRYDSERLALDTRIMKKSRFETRLAGDDAYWYDSGNDEGVRNLHFNTGQATLGVRHACTPIHIIRCRGKGDEWRRHDGDTVIGVGFADRSPDRNILSDPRALGLMTRSILDVSPSQLLEELQSTRGRWSVKESAGLVEVTLKKEPLVENSPTRSELVWRVDPAKDDAVVEVVLRETRSDGTVRNINVVKNEYMRVDDRWWLKRSENTSITHGVVEVYTFHHAEFDRPDHPKSLGVDTFNMPPGVQVADFRLAAQGIYGMDAMGRYLGGSVIVSEAEWREQIAPGFDMESLRQFMDAELAAHGHGQYPRWWGASDSTLGLDGVASDPDQWEAYVRRWILRHSHQVVVDLKAKTPASTLTAAQIESAWAILKDCRKRAEPVLRRKAKADSARAESTASAISQPSTAPAGDGRHDDGTAPSADRSEDRFERELGKVFELLKNRLNGLLQSKQVQRLTAE